MKDENTPLVYIVLVNYCNFSDTLECLESLMSLDYPNFRIIICDNGSSDDSLNNIERWCKMKLSGNFDILSEQDALRSNKISNKKITIIKKQFNQGFASGNNTAIKYALKYDEALYFWLLNNDTVVDRASLSNLVKKAAKDKNFAMIGSTILDYSNKHLVQILGGGSYNPIFSLTKHIGAGLKWPLKIGEAKVENKMDYVAGVSMLVSRKFIEKVGLMSEDYFLYFEELDWAIRAKKTNKNWRFGYASESIVYHKEGATIGSSAQPNYKLKSPQADYWGLRNRLTFTFKHYPYYLPTVWLGLCGSVARRLLRGQFYQALIAFKILFGLRSKTSKLQTNNG